MSDEQTEQTEQTGGRRRAAAAEKPRPKRGDVVTFRFFDEVTGRRLDSVGVVSRSDGDGAVAIRPIAEHDVWVDVVDVDLVVTADD